MTGITGQSRYLAEAVRQMVDPHWNPESEARDAELIYNKNADGSSTHRNRFSNLMLHLDVAGNHMDPPTGHDEHHNDRRAYLGLQQGQQWEPVKMYR